jgi:hypothetical protein
MHKAKQDDGLTKFQRYRLSQSGKGMKLLRMWAPDPTTDEFRVEAKRQVALLRGAPEETDALRFIESATAWPER